jgi:PAS domain S-box-containing protein
MPQGRATNVSNIELFRDVFEASPIGIAVETLEGQPLFVNPALCSMLGLSEQELLEKHCVDFSPPEDADKDWQLFQRLKAGLIDHYKLEKRYFRRDGSLFWGSLSISLLKGRESPLVLGMVENITEKKWAEEAKSVHAAIVESSEDAISSVTLDGVILTWNAGAQRMFGYTEKEAVGKPVTLIVPPERPDEENKILETLRAGGRIEHFETVRVSKTGKRIDVSLSISPIKDSTGKIVGCAGIARDISYRKSAEQRLREYERAIELSGEAIAVVDRDYRFRIANRRYLRLRKMTQEQVVGHFVHEVLNKGVFEAVVKEKLDECFQGKVVRYEMKYTYPELGERDVLVSYFPIEGANGVDRVASIMQDITERKRAEYALRESEQRFRLVANTAPVMIWMSGQDRKPTYFNQLWLDFTGLSETDLQNGLEGIVHPEDYQQCHDTYCRGFDQRQPFKKECRLRRHDGQYRWMLDIGVPRFHKDGSFAGYIGSCIDVTDQKLAEEALSSMSQKLLGAQEQERARIARELHDDINQRVAMLAVELDQIRHNNPALPSEVLSTVQELRKRTIEISSDVQALSHDLHSSQLEYLGAVAGMKSWCKEFAERQKMEIDCRHDVRSTLPPEIGLSLFRVLQEAVNNAIKHSGEKRVEVQLREDSGQIHLIVRDSGKGFDVETALCGKGLGLTSMRERIRLVNGTIAIESRPMGGTTIHVRIPLEGRSNAARLSA